MRCDLKVEKEVGVKDRRKQENSSKGARNERDEAYWDISTKEVDDIWAGLLTERST